jgi:hypothetical protein
MFERWRQENFFKYMRQEFLIDTLVDYQAEPDDPNRSIPNPARKTVNQELCNARARRSRATGFHPLGKWPHRHEGLLWQMRARMNPDGFGTAFGFPLEHQGSPSWSVFFMPRRLGICF